MKQSATSDARDPKRPWPFARAPGRSDQQKRGPWGRLRSPPLLVRRWIPRFLSYRTGSRPAIAFAPVPRVNFAFAGVTFCRVNRNILGVLPGPPSAFRRNRPSARAPGARRVCPPWRRRIAAAGSGRMPNAPRLSTWARWAVMRRSAGSAGQHRCHLPPTS